MDLFMTRGRVVSLLIIVCGSILLLGQSVLYDLRVDNLGQFATPTALRGGMKYSINSVHMDDNFRHIHWFVQLSDLHLSKFYDKARISDLKYFCEQLGVFIHPEVVLVTGDITDAKHENKEGSQQYEQEWLWYDKVLQESKILEKTVWLDVRGNHDTFNVPSLKSAENFFRHYSVQGVKNMLSYHYLHNTSDGDVISFIAVDACLNPGVKRPFNFFGYLSQVDVDLLSEFVRASSHADQTIFFGHYPSSTISGVSASTIRQLFGSGSLYLCGHLHSLGGIAPQMYSRQKTGYLELELSDWKDHRIYRLLAFDHGIMSFIDVPFNSWPVVLITNPKNALFLIESHEPTEMINLSTHIRILAFSNVSIATVTVTLDGKHHGEAIHTEGPLFVLPWDPLMFGSGLHSIVVHVVDEMGQETTLVQTFSIDGSRPYFDFRQRFILMADHVRFVRILFAGCYLLTVLPLVVLRIFRIHLRVYVQSACGSCCFRSIQRWIRRMFVLCSTSRVFYPLMIYNVWLVIGPWFVGEVLDGHLAVCFIFGLVMKDTFLPMTLTYIYGTLQLLTFNIPLTLYLARCLDSITTSQHRDRRMRFGVIVWLLDHSVFVLLISLQVYLAITGFYRAYGLIALLVCPLRTWATVLAIFLRYQALKEPALRTDQRSTENTR